MTRWSSEELALNNKSLVYQWFSDDDISKTMLIGDAYPEDPVARINSLGEGKVKTYDVERTMCDISHDRNNQDPSIVNDAIKRYLSRKDKDLNKLICF